MEVLNDTYKLEATSFWKFSLTTGSVIAIVAFLASLSQGFNKAFGNAFMMIFLTFAICGLLFAASGGYLMSSRFFASMKIRQTGDYFPILQKRLEEEFGTKFTYFDAFPVVNGLPYAIGYDGKKILVVEKGAYAFLGKSDIRSFYWEIKESYQQNTQVIGSIRGAILASANDTIQNAQNHFKAVDTSGMSIKTANVEKPVWFLVFGVEAKTYQKWEEIFNQIFSNKLHLD